jgi:hypothetical protein
MSIKQAIMSGILMYAGYRIAEAVSDRMKASANNAKDKLYSRTIAAVNTLFGKTEEVKEENNESEA